MYAAKIQLSWLNQCFEGENAVEILEQLERYQDFDCLLGMGRAREDKKGQKELDKLEAFLKKYHDGSLTMSDLEQLNVKLSIGDIICHGIAEGEEEISKLRET